MEYEPNQNQNGGRSFYKLDWNKIDGYLEADCNGIEIAAELGIHHQTLYSQTEHNFGISWTEYSLQKRSKGVLKLREAQYLKATGLTKKGDTTLLMHLGRVRLKQVDAQPEKAVDIPPLDESIRKEDVYLKSEAEKLALKAENEELKRLLAIQSQTNPELPPSHKEVQHMGGSSEVREDSHQYPQIDSLDEGRTSW